MSLSIKDSTGTTRNVLEVQDLAASKFACISSVIEPTVSSNNTIDGTGSSANPLAVVPSTDAGNAITLGTDGKILVAPNRAYARATNNDILSSIAALVEERVRYTNVVADPMSMITTGASWNATIPITGVYHVAASCYIFITGSGNSNWGVFSPGTTANGTIFIKVNGTVVAFQSIGMTPTAGLDTPCNPFISAIMPLTVGDVVTVFWQHSDNSFQHALYDDVYIRSGFSLCRVG